MLTEVTGAAELELKRDSAVVCVALGAGVASHDRGEDAVGTVRSVLAHTDERTPILLAAEADDLRRIAGALEPELSRPTLFGLPLDAPSTPVRALNLALRLSAPADVALVAPGVRVTAGWLEKLRSAALSDSTVASATPLSVGWGGLSLIAGQPRPAQDGARPGSGDGGEPEAAIVAGRALALYPRTAAIGPACAYLRRSTLELLGALDERLDLSAALDELAARAVACGMLHVVADDVLVVGGSEPAMQAPEGPVQATLVGDERGRLQRVLGVGRAALQGLSLTIDGRALTATSGGTQTYILDLVTALRRAGKLSLRVLVAPRDLSPQAAAALDTLDVEQLTYEQAIDGARMSDVVHRPQQAFTPDDVALLRLVGKRVVIGQQDLIAYHNPAYHEGIERWRAYRRTTRMALAGADQVVFFSEHARRDALAEDLLWEGRTHVVGAGADALQAEEGPELVPEDLGTGEPFLLCLGADYAHKNRPFAIELLAALNQMGWCGRLVLAGTHVPHGSSRERERALLDADRALAQHVLDLGPVDEPQKAWLYRNARALLYPTLYEGFGLLPLEAAREGLPCLFAAQASLGEIAPGAATLVAWDAAASAAAVMPLLDGGPQRERHLAELSALPVPTWDVVAGQLLDVYEQAVRAPGAEAAPHVWQELDRERYIVELDQDVSKLKAIAQDYQNAYHDLGRRVAAGLPLIDEGGLLSEAQQRGLMRVAGRGRLGALALSPFGLLGGAGAGGHQSDEGSEGGSGPTRRT